jgi:hypothetical protein
MACNARAASRKNKAGSSSGRAATIGRSSSGSVHVGIKYGTGNSRAICRAVDAGVPAPPQRGHARWWQL